MSAIGPQSPSDFLEFIRMATRLKKLERRGWVDTSVSPAESIADHSYLTALLAAFLAEPAGLDSGRCVKLALVHDLPEVVTGDVTPYDPLVARGVRPEEAAGRWRELSSRREQVELKRIKDVRENQALEQLAGLLPSGSQTDVRDLWVEYSTSATPEARFVRQLDKTEALIQALEYRREGQPADAESFLRTAREIVTDPVLLPIVDALESDLASLRAKD